MNNNNIHWYLTVIYMDKMEVHMVDSQPSDERHEMPLQTISDMVGLKGSTPHCYNWFN
ncbi:hypothetical protein LINPERHAP2_LOCUS16852 [Linum perenne]